MTNVGDPALLARIALGEEGAFRQVYVFYYSTEPFDHIHVSLESPADTPEQILVTAEVQQKIQIAAEALPPRCKMIFKLVCEDGPKGGWSWPSKDIAGMTWCVTAHSTPST